MVDRQTERRGPGVGLSEGPDSGPVVSLAACPIRAAPARGGDSTNFAAARDGGTPSSSSQSLTSDGDDYRYEHQPITEMTSW